MSKLLKCLVCVIYISATLVSSTSAAGNVVCYYNSSAIVRPGNGKFTLDEVDPTLCTHIVYSNSAINVSHNGSLVLPDSFDPDEIESLIDLKKQNANLKVMLHLFEDFNIILYVIPNVTTRQNFAHCVKNLLEEYSFDGFDMSWEFPFENQTDNFTMLLGELQSVLHSDGKILSLVVSGHPNITKLYDIGSVSQIVDMLNIDAMNYHGDYETFVGHYAPLYASHFDQDETLNVASGIEAWLDGGADPSKINLGIGSYGKGFTLADPTNISLYASAVGGNTAGPYTGIVGQIGFNEICEFYKDWEQTWDDEQEVPHIVDGDQWIGFNDRTAIELKIKYTHMKSLGGVFFGPLDTDDFRGVCGGGVYPLLHTINWYI